MFLISAEVLSFKSCNVRGLFAYTLCFSKPQRKKSGPERSGDFRGQLCVRNRACHPVRAHQKHSLFNSVLHGCRLRTADTFRDCPRRCSISAATCRIIRTPFELTRPVDYYVEMKLIRKQNIPHLWYRDWVQQLSLCITEEECFAYVWTSSSVIQRLSCCPYEGSNHFSLRKSCRTFNTLIVQKKYFF
jgi:hypothetical protein